MWKQSKMCSAPCFMRYSTLQNTLTKKYSHAYHVTMEQQAICGKKTIEWFSRNLSKSVQQRVRKNNGRSFREVTLVCRQSMKITPLWDNRSSASGAHTHTEHIGFNTGLFPHSSGCWPAQMFQQSSCGFQWKEEITEKEKCLGELLQTDEYFAYQVHHHAHQSYSNWIFSSVIYVKITCKCSVSSLNYKRTLHLSYLIYFS